VLEGPVSLVILDQCGAYVVAGAARQVDYLPDLVVGAQRALLSSSATMTRRNRALTAPEAVAGSAAVSIIFVSLAA
jgi:hypothetical protein